MQSIHWLLADMTSMLNTKTLYYKIIRQTLKKFDYPKKCRMHDFHRTYGWPISFIFW